MHEKTICLECKNIFPKHSMISGTKTNSYGDKTKKGYFCYSCYKKRIERRSWILLIFAIGFFCISLFLFSIAIWSILFSQGFTQSDIKVLLEIFFFWGGLMALFGLILIIIRKKELSNITKLLKRQQPL